MTKVIQAVPFILGILDLVLAYDYARKGSWKLALVWACYAVAATTLGLVQEAK